MPPEVTLDFDPRLHIKQVPDNERSLQTPPRPPLGPNGKQFSIIDDSTEPRYVLARLGNNGPVIASTAVKGFRLFNCIDTYLNVTSMSFNRIRMVVN